MASGEKDCVAGNVVAPPRGEKVKAASSVLFSFSYAIAKGESVLTNNKSVLQSKDSKYHSFFS